MRLHAVHGPPGNDYFCPRLEMTLDWSWMREEMGEMIENAEKCCSFPGNLLAAAEEIRVPAINSKW